MISFIVVQSLILMIIISIEKTIEILTDKNNTFLQKFLKNLKFLGVFFIFLVQIIFFRNLYENIFHIFYIIYAYFFLNLERKIVKNILTFLILLSTIFSLSNILVLKQKKNTNNIEKFQANYVLIEKVEPIKKQKIYKQFGSFSRPKKEVFLPNDFSSLNFLIDTNKTFVKKGELIAKFDVEAYELELESAKAELDFAKNKIERLKKYDLIASIEELENTKRILKQSQSKVQQMEERIKKGSLYAEEDYFVHHYFVSKGQLHREQKILTLFKANELHFEVLINPVSLDFSSGDLNNIESAYVKIDGKKIYLDLIYSDTICEDSLTSSFKLVFRVRDPEFAKNHLHSETTGECKIKFKKSENMFKIPESAIQIQRSSNIVYIVQKNQDNEDEVIGTEVNIKKVSKNGSVYVDNLSLKEEDVIVIEGGNKLSDLAKVKILEKKEKVKQDG